MSVKNSLHLTRLDDDFSPGAGAREAKIRQAIVKREWVPLHHSRVPNKFTKRRLTDPGLLQTAKDNYCSTRAGGCRR